MPIRIEHEEYAPPRIGLLLLQCLIALLLCVFIARFWYLQIHKGDEYAKQALANRIRQEHIFASRGIIRDVKGTILADNRQTFSLVLVRENCSDIPSTLAQASLWGNIPYEQLTAKFNRDRRKVKPFEPITLLSDLKYDKILRIESELANWPGLEIVMRQRRSYPLGPYFAHILGYVAEVNEKELSENSKFMPGDLIGKSGIEYTFDNRLRGTKGRYSINVDVLGNSLGKHLEEKPMNGENLTLCLDADLQRSLTDLLGDKTGSIIVLEPQTGRLKALVTTPSYDNNLFIGGLSHSDWKQLRDDPLHPLQNRTIQSSYPPGSVWKLMMAGLFLRNGISTGSGVWCTGAIQMGNRQFRCWKASGHGFVNFESSLLHSCDVYYYVYGEKLGVDRIEKFARACGFGTPTGIDLPHEKGGTVPSIAWKKRRFGTNWVRGETLNVSIGQGYTLVTPLQVAVFVGSLLNGGKLMKPLLLLDEEPAVRGTTPMTEQDRRIILEGMRKTADIGTARVLRRKDAIIGGKTGTAQVVKIRMIGSRRQRTSEMAYKERDHAWIASWGKKDGKDIVVVVMLEHGGSGSSAAGPIARQVYDILYAASSPGQTEQNRR
ncbi:MAG: penicillin-binding protein 2 [Desulfovibrionaceae bacterium]|nr:penicillin-binding protein 2 [Desulfovibrionaceae bacterium]